MKVWKKILIVIGIILVIFVIITLRKFVIFSNLNKKNIAKQANTNVYAKVVSESATIEMYRKGDVIKQVIRKNGTNVVLTQLTKPEYRIFYTDDGNQKTMRRYEEQFLIENQNIVVNYANYFTISEKILSSIGSRITSETVDGRKCYVISGYNTNFVYDENATDLKLYIDKETGLAIKWMEKIQDGENKKDSITTYEYQFDCVTDEDVAELDKMEYQLLEG